MTCGQSSFQSFYWWLEFQLIGTSAVRDIIKNPIGLSYELQAFVSVFEPVIPKFWYALYLYLYLCFDRSPPLHWLELWDASFASFNPQLFQVCNLPMIAITRRFFNRPRVYLRFCGQNKRSSRVCLQKIDGSLGRAQSLSAESTETYGPVSTLGQMSRFNLAPNTPLAEEPILPTVPSSSSF